MGRTPSLRAGIAFPAYFAGPLLIALLATAVGGGYYLGQRSGGTQIIASGLRIEDIRQIAKLAVLRVQVASVIEGKTRGARAVVLVHGDADIALDLDAIEVRDVDPTARTATLHLPPPQPERPRVNHERTRLYEIRKTGLAALNPFADPREDLLEDCMRAAQSEVRQAVQDDQFVSQAREQSELLLKAFYQQLDWTIEIQWSAGGDAL